MRIIGICSIPIRDNSEHSNTLYCKMRLYWPQSVPRTHSVHGYSCKKSATKIRVFLRILRVQLLYYVVLVCLSFKNCSQNFWHRKPRNRQIRWHIVSARWILSGTGRSINHSYYDFLRSFVWTLCLSTSSQHIRLASLFKFLKHLQQTIPHLPFSQSFHTSIFL